MLSALLPEIDYTYSFSGHLPFIYKIGTDSFGDYEQQFLSYGQILIIILFIF